MELTYLEAIRQGIGKMDRDPLSSASAKTPIYGGAFKVTDGFIDRFGPERVIDTPIADSAIGVWLSEIAYRHVGSPNFSSWISLAAPSTRFQTW